MLRVNEIIIRIFTYQEIGFRGLILSSLKGFHQIELSGLLFDDLSLFVALFFLVAVHTFLEHLY